MNTTWQSFYLLNGISNIRRKYKSSANRYNSTVSPLGVIYGVNFLISALMAPSMITLSDSEEQGVSLAKTGIANTYFKANIFPEVSFGDSAHAKVGQKLELRLDYRF